VPPASGSPLARFVELLRARSLPRPDLEPLAVGDHQVVLVWRAHYVTAALDVVPAELVSKLEDRGFEFHSLGGDAAAWPAALDRLAASLGRAS
jgi:hypothetical protein